MDEENNASGINTAAAAAAVVVVNGSARNNGNDGDKNWKDVPLYVGNKGEKISSGVLAKLISQIEFFDEMSQMSKNNGNDLESGWWMNGHVLWSSHHGKKSAILKHLSQHMINPLEKIQSPFKQIVRHDKNEKVDPKYLDNLFSDDVDIIDVRDEDIQINYGIDTFSDKETTELLKLTLRLKYKPKNNESDPFEKVYNQPNQPIIPRNHGLYNNHHPICDPNELDIVYTWVNGTDPMFINVLSHFQPVDKFSSVRYRDYDSLRYSLRSVEKYSPFVRRIYIFTNGQVPFWLNLNHPKIFMVSHQQAFHNLSNLPTFSSNAIEVMLDRIPGLSECFWLMNDDMFWNNPVDPNQFFNPNTNQLLLHPSTWLAPKEKESRMNSWHHGISKCDAMLKKKFGKKSKHYYPEHGCYFFQKSVLRYMYQFWPLEVNVTAANRFRARGSVTVPFMHHQLAMHMANATNAPSRFTYYAKAQDEPKSNDRVFEEIKKRNRMCVCLNDGFLNPTKKSLMNVKDHFQKLFPQRSSFEIDSPIFDINPKMMVMKNTIKKPEDSLHELDAKSLSEPPGVCLKANELYIHRFCAKNINSQHQSFYLPNVVSDFLKNVSSEIYNKDNKSKKVDLFSHEFGKYMLLIEKYSPSSSCQADLKKILCGIAYQPCSPTFNPPLPAPPCYDVCKTAVKSCDKIFSKFPLLAPDCVKISFEKQVEYFPSKQNILCNDNSNYNENKIWEEQQLKH